MPSLFSQFKESMGFPPESAPFSAAPIAGPSSSFRPSIPTIPVAPVLGMPSTAVANFSTAPGAPSIPIVNDSDSDPEVQSLTIPFRSGSSSSENFLPMVSTDDNWISELEFRFVSSILCNIGLYYIKPFSFV